MVNRKDIIYKTNKCIYNFQNLEPMTSFAKNIFGGKITLDDTS